MDGLILSSSPNTDGLTAACVEAVKSGFSDADRTIREVRLTDAGVGSCRQCNDGWGTCRTDGVCQVEDGFQSVHDEVRAAEALIVVTPVYWGDLSESAKCFTDRLRRCEATRGDGSRLSGRWFMGVAAAGGGGGGTVSCLGQMDRLLGHMRMKRWDLVGLSRWTREAKLDAIRTSARALAGTLPEQEGHDGME